MEAKCVHLFSDGLDSLLALKLLESLGVEVMPVRLYSLFFPLKHKMTPEETKRRMMEDYGIDLSLIDITDEAIEVVKSPKFGYGGCMNPCIDCRILMYRKAGELMKEWGADFVSTGEVVGQRPMTQFRRSLTLAEREAHLEGLILRPLSAKILKPTIVEQKGLVDREKLFDIEGRSRRRQLMLAEELGLQKVPQPAGGCLLTDENYSRKLKDILLRGFRSRAELELLSVGRHFRIGEAKLIVGRNEKENAELDRIRPDYAIRIEPTKVMGPVALLFADEGEMEGRLDTALKILIRYSDAEYGEAVECEVRLKDERRCLERKKEEIETSAFRI